MGTTWTTESTPIDCKPHTSTALSTGSTRCTSHQPSASPQGVLQMHLPTQIDTTLDSASCVTAADIVTSVSSPHAQQFSSMPHLSDKHVASTDLVLLQASGADPSLEGSLVSVKSPGSSVPTRIHNDDAVMTCTPASSQNTTHITSQANTTSPLAASKSYVELMTPSCQNPFETVQQESGSCQEGDIQLQHSGSLLQHDSIDVPVRPGCYSDEQAGNVVCDVADTAKLMNNDDSCSAADVSAEEMKSKALKATDGALEAHEPLGVSTQALIDHVACSNSAMTSDSDVGSKSETSSTGTTDDSEDSGLCSLSDDQNMQSSEKLSAVACAQLPEPGNTIPA